MNILLIGPQGSGKGTQARILCEKFNFFYFESGGFLRKVAEKDEALRKSLAEGNLVPDREMTSYLTAFFDQKNLYDDIIFDGFPRTRDQYDFFKKWLTDKGVRLDLVIVLEISEDETVRRLSARRSDPATGKIYNLITDPPPGDLKCECKGELVQREDDYPDVIKKRLKAFNKSTLEVAKRALREGILLEIDGERPVEEIYREIVSWIN
ncbi:MAG: Adenylate kinase [Candidatus Amesbacteria bacterium GW2011_GWC1_48_10]|uniref:Adenylate kinase n=1 Tax=Candidatus Amesbacteria bacterium GW2011_GWC1_48_10 TaxID=1618365 RepID=A0A0G1UH33_9BACT|nr:MAG: Adenylate kinase [Candidatus Amesbacteria bacterium GW2011_GWC1_48_10]